MVLLWKDPKGKTVTMIKKVGTPPPPNSNSSTKEAQKIATLEKSITEKDMIIAQLKEEINTLKGVCLITINHNLIPRLPDLFNTPSFLVCIQKIDGEPGMIMRLLNEVLCHTIFFLHRIKTILVPKYEYVRMNRNLAKIFI